MASAPAVLYWLISLMVVCWSANYIVAKIALREFPALLLTALRAAIAGSVMIPLYIWEQSQPGALQWKRSDLPVLLYLGIFGVSLNQLCFITGISRTTVAHSAMMISLTPVCVLLIAAALKQERITFSKLTGMVLATTGVAVLQIFRAQGGTAAGGPTLAGDVLVLLAAVTFSLFTVIGKSVSLRHSAITVNTFAYVGGALTLAPFALFEARRVSFAQISPAAWAGLIYMAVFPSVICYLIYYYALKRISASRASAFSYLQPLLAILMAVAVLGERLTSSVIAGGLIIFAGVFLTEHGMFAERG